MALGNAAGKSCVNRRGIAKIWYKVTPAAAVAAALIAGGVAHEAWAQSYRFNRISVEGNQRIQTGTIANYAGLDNSRPVSAGELNDAYQRIVNSGLFESVELVPSGSTLVVRVVEYPTINRINFEGN
ncbi:MAG: outer membrane protein assembly factor BamA, partial [Pseudomonadota bacterium]|nr:outer membrane protein assembly factor BamA [Pseudomonadota bacterium]